MSQTRDDREFKQGGEAEALGEKRRGCWLVEVKLDVTLGNQDRRSERKAKEHVWKKRNRGLEPFNYSTCTQQRPRFQETITVCSLQGETHLASFISPTPSPQELKVGIINVFFCCTEQTHRLPQPIDVLSACISHLALQVLLLEEKPPPCFKIQSVSFDQDGPDFCQHD